MAGLLTNVFDSEKPTFGTFNINQSNDLVERFLSPPQPRQFKLILQRSFGGS